MNENHESFKKAVAAVEACNEWGGLTDSSLRDIAFDYKVDADEIYTAVFGEPPVKIE